MVAMTKIVFIDQAIGLPIQELVLAATAAFGSVSYYNPVETMPNENVRLVRMPRHVNRSTLGRVFAWFHYLAKACWYILGESEKPLLFIVTNPPLSPMLGVIAKKLKRQRYILLFYDMYPEAFERFRNLSRTSLIAKGWRSLNRLAIKHAAAVVTISPQLAMTLGQYYESVARIPPVKVVTTWVDTERIAPLPKEKNWFAQQWGQVGKLTVLYSGNLGMAHDLTMVPRVAYQLRENSDIHFLIVGDGTGRKLLERECAQLDLPNVTLLPLQPEKVLPFLLATADIGLVALANGAEGISMPSKTYYMMAAGSALLGLSNNDSDLANVIRDTECGVNVTPGDVDSAAQAILQLRDQPMILQQYRTRARQVAEERFSRRVCVPQMLEIIQDILQ
jgi:colanic acid biosynthesis glycosyl transferase WcaI